MKVANARMQTSVRFIAVLIATLFIGSAFANCSTSSSGQSEASDPVVITDISSWEHPVKKVFTDYKVRLYKVELTKCKKYPIFYVSFPYDPQSSETTDYFYQLYAEVLEANGWWNYALRDENDHIKVEIAWDKKKKVMSTNFVELPEN